MFSKILCTILLISILNEICHAERLRGCVKFSDADNLDSSANEKDLVVKISSDITSDESFLPVVVHTGEERGYLILDSCEKGAKTQDIVNGQQLTERLKKYNETTKNSITIPFDTLENKCIPVADVGTKLQKVFYPKQTIPTLYVDLSLTKAITKKTIKRLTKDQFLLSDDCTSNSGDTVNITQLSNIIQQMAKGVQEAALIEFPDTKNCKTYVEIAGEILASLKKKYPDNTNVQGLKASETVPASLPPADAGTSLIYQNKVFSQIEDCKKRFRYPLTTAAEVEEVLNNIADPEIKRVQDELAKT